MINNQNIKCLKPARFILAGIFFLSANVLAAPNPTAQLMQKMNQIQAEIQALRDEVERQKFTLDTALKSQKDRYLDIDQRLASQDAQIKKLEALLMAIGADASLLTNPNSSSKTTTNLQPKEVVETPAPSKQKPNLSDTQFYNIASKLRTQRKFDEASLKFQDFINFYPGSPLVSNAYYWLGEIYMLENKTQEAEKMFSIVANKYSSSNKALDAWYKLGLVQARYGNMAKAKRAMLTLSRKYPNSTAGELATTWLKRNK